MIKSSEIGSQLGCDSQSDNFVIRSYSIAVFIGLNKAFLGIPSFAYLLIKRQLIKIFFLLQLLFCLNGS